MYFMLTGGVPFKAKNEKILMEKVLTAEFETPSEFSEEAKDLLRRLLWKNPKERLGGKGGAREVKRHAFFASVNWTELVKNRDTPVFDNDAEETRGEEIEEEYIDSDDSGDDEKYAGFSFINPAVDEHYEGKR